jgi:hypothetical protein
MAQNESLKIKIRESRILTNPDPKDLIRGFVSKKKIYQITRFVLFWKDWYTIPASLILKHWIST